MALVRFLVPLLFLTMIASIFFNKNITNRENFAISIRMLYMYSILLVSLFLILFGIIFAWMNITNLILPESATTQTINQDLFSQNQRNNALRMIYTSFSAIVLGISIFAYHKKKLK